MNLTLLAQYMFYGDNDEALPALVKALADVAELPESEMDDDYMIGYWMFWAGAALPENAPAKALKAYRDATSDKQELS